MFSFHKTIKVPCSYDVPLSKTPKNSILVIPWSGTPCPLNIIALYCMIFTQIVIRAYNNNSFSISLLKKIGENSETSR